MIISFFSPTEYVTDIDLSYTEGSPAILAILDEETGEVITPEIPATPTKGNPDCIAVFDVEFDPTTQDIQIENKKGKYKAIITDKEIQDTPESPEEKHTRIYQSIISSEILDDIDLEGEIFSDFEVGELITARVFGGNPHAQLVAYIKWNELDKKKDREGLLEDEENEYFRLSEKLSQVNIVRNLFNLGNL